jgi:polyribonucleotide nucleotidyltransferase
LDLVITGTTAGIIALWGSGREIANATVLAAIDEARRPLRSICQTMDSLRRDLGRSAMDSPGPSPDAGMVPAATDLPDRKFLTETSVLPGSHGSALLSYGRTQVLASVLLSAERTKDAQMSFGLRGSEGRPIDVMRYEEFMTRAFAIVGPEEFPYSIACTMDVISLDTSFYAAAVAAASLAFFDAGIQLSSAVAAVTEVRVEENGPWVRATELQAGDLATVATIAGTRRGITALMLTSYDGVIDPNAIGSLLDRASNGRIELIDLMRETISAPRQELSQLAPRVVSLKVPRDRVRDVIGSAGKTLRWISEETGTKISVGESGDVVIEGSDQPRVERAAVIIEQLTAAPEIGRRYKGTIKRIEPYGAFVEILPGQDGLLHISEMAHGRIGQVTDLFALGDEIEVEVVSIEPDSGKIRLSRKPLLPPITEEELAEERSRADVPRRQRRQPRLPARDRDESDE